MSETGSFLQNLENAVSLGSPEKRKQALWHATDLLIEGHYSEDQIWVFGEVIERLAGELELAARAQLATKLAPASNAPTQILNRLALDDSIDVAGPVLQHSQRLDVRTLVAAASSKSQKHLLAISRRTTMSEEVTDVLVARGNDQVLNSVAVNPGARLSSTSFLSMVKRSENDSILAETLGQRKDIPRHIFQQLIAKASDQVKRKLVGERPELSSHIQTSVADATGTMHSKFGPASKEYFAAKKAVMSQHLNGGLKEKHILRYAQMHQFEETLVALSRLSSLPANVVEQALTEKKGEMLLVVAKALGYSWETAMALLFLGAQDHRISAQHLDDLRGEFAKLGAETCRRILKAYQARQQKSAANSGQNRLPQLHERRS